MKYEERERKTKKTKERERKKEEGCGLSVSSLVFVTIEVIVTTDLCSNNILVTGNLATLSSKAHFSFASIDMSRTRVLLGQLDQ